MTNVECDVLKKKKIYFNLQYPIQKETQTEMDTNIDFQTAGDFSRECNKKICRAL